MKPFFQETAPLIQEPTSLPRSSASLKPVKAQTVQPKAQGSKRVSVLTTLLHSTADTVHMNKPQHHSPKDMVEISVRLRE